MSDELTRIGPVGIAVYDGTPVVIVPDDTDTILGFDDDEDEP